MNRRYFITKALAGLAAVPLAGKLAHTAHAQCPSIEMGMAMRNGFEAGIEAGRRSYTLWDEIEQIRAAEDYSISVQEALDRIRAVCEKSVHVTFRIEQPSHDPSSSTTV